MIKNKLGKLKYKNVIICIIFIVVISVLLLILLKPSSNLTNEKALEIGEEKYLEFLWMVDGAFNYNRYNEEEFTVNNKAMKDKLDFSCEYDNNKNICHATNFEKNYYNTFASNIKMDLVYGDGVAIKWYAKTNSGYEFNNSNKCEALRMNSKHNLKVNSISSNKIVYQATFDDEVISGIYKGKHHYDNEFVLVYENNTWKVSEAYYHDPCYAEYLIK